MLHRLAWESSDGRIAALTGRGLNQSFQPIPERLSIRTEAATNDDGAIACENCSWHPLVKYPTINSIMWYCPRCRLYQKGRVFTAAEYDLHYHVGYQARQRRKHRTALIRLSRIAGLLDVERPRLLDVGCSLGYTVEAAGELGWQGFGVDVNPRVIAVCRRRKLRCQVVRGPGLPYPDAFFDAVTAWHVIEHVADVSESLAEWARVLRPGGILAIETLDSSCLKLKWRGPNYRTFWAPEHVYTFNRHNLGNLVRAARFEVVSPPRVGAVEKLSPKMALYAVGYLFFKGLQARLGLSKNFQMFCRRTGAAIPAVTRRAA